MRLWFTKPVNSVSVWSKENRSKGIENWLLKETIEMWWSYSMTEV